MAGKSRTVRRSVRTAPVPKAASGLAITWEGTREAFGSAEAALERQLRALVKRGSARGEEAASTLMTWRGRLERERRKAMKQMEQRLALLQTRARRERKAVRRFAGEAVQGALAALNIPSRQEVHELTRRVEELSRKIDGFRRTSTPRRTRTGRVATPAVRAEAQA
jgi:polyhydroxyalkanoate synthesis regulator phasin